MDSPIKVLIREQSHITQEVIYLSKNVKEIYPIPNPCKSYIYHVFIFKN